jgi:type VI secretion system secreted protein VgrG
VTSARFVQHENRRGVYEIVLRPWLILATRTSDYKIFQNRTPLEIIEEVLADYSFPTEKRVTIVTRNGCFKSSTARRISNSSRG